jgi:hypothetical protein
MRVVMSKELAPQNNEIILYTTPKGLKEAPTIRKFRIVQPEGGRQVSSEVDFYHLDAIIAFLKFNEYEVLEDSGRVSHEVAASLAGKEYEKFRVTQDREYIGDFEKEVKRITSRQRQGKDKTD